MSGHDDDVDDDEADDYADDYDDGHDEEREQYECHNYNTPGSHLNACLVRDFLSE